MGGGGASPGPAGVLQCESAGLGWPPNVRLPRAGLPRRWLRGECAGALRMAEADSAAASDMSEPALPDPKGEGIEQYIQRAVADDEMFKGLARHARYLGVEVVLPSVCRPAFLSLEAVQAYYQAFARLDQDPRADGFWRLTDHLWISGNAKSLPLDLRMTEVANPIVDEVPQADEGTTRSWIETIQAICKAVYRRDSLIAGAFDALRAGRWTASGFLPGDHLRQSIPINGAWWADEQVQCDWRRGELHPWDAATPGRPTFLGISLAVALQQPSFSKQERGVEPALQPTRKTHMIEDEEACAIWLTEQWPLDPRTKKPAWKDRVKQQPQWKLLSDLGFNRAWAVAARTHSRMLKGGRSPKLPR